MVGQGRLGQSVCWRRRLHPLPVLLVAAVGQLQHVNGVGTLSLSFELTRQRQETQWGPVCLRFSSVSCLG